jgi:hypothetical protein
MNASALAKHYGSLTPEERFRLILAAGARGDDAERERLMKAGGRLTLSMQDHAPYSHAFEELALLIFIELLEEAARYDNAYERASDALDIFAGATDATEDAEEEEAEGDGAEEDEPMAEPSEGDARERPPAWQRSLELAYAAGFMLRTKAGGWKLFCERLNVPPFVLWEGLPGCDRLRRALALAEDSAFLPEGFLCWLNRIRPKGKPELTEVPLTVEGMADATEDLFRKRVDWWGG